MIVIYIFFAADLPDTDSISYCNTNCIGVLFFSVIQQKFVLIIMKISLFVKMIYSIIKNRFIGMVSLELLISPLKLQSEIKIVSSKYGELMDKTKIQNNTRFENFFRRPIDNNNQNNLG